MDSNESKLDGVKAKSELKKENVDEEICSFLALPTKARILCLDSL
jgi:hypothetical protein